MSDVGTWAPPLRRLHDELSEDGVRLPAHPWVVAAALDELDHARRPPVFERRTPVYGSIVFGPTTAPSTCGRIAELVDLGMLDLDAARRFADGRSSFLVRSLDQQLMLACFERSVQYEADLVEIQQATGALIVQRTVMGTVRLLSDEGVVQWTGREWTTRLGARAHLSVLAPLLPRLPEAVLAGLLDLAVHWLSPARIGTTFVVAPGAGPAGGLDLGRAMRAPALSVSHRRHYAALFASLMQTDLAVTLDLDGTVHHTGVGLLATPRAEELVPASGGMRHTSARRYSFDHPEALVVVVSEDGPVTLFASGAPVAVCAPAEPFDTGAAVVEGAHRCTTCGSELLVGPPGGSSCSPGGPICPVCESTQALPEGVDVLRAVTSWER
ncbi:MAG: diadenylate cyclase [Actinomycetota bacterium]